MASTRARKALLWVVVATIAGMVSSCALQSIHTWVQDQRNFPPEQVYVSAVSPDGERLALFSIKYQSVSRWIPDYEPHAYVTVIETEHGSILVRETACGGSIKTRFVELAREHAPWAVEEVTDLAWKSGALTVLQTDGQP